MKIYHKQDIGVDKIIEACDRIISVIPEEYKIAIAPLVNIVKSSNEQRAFYFQECEKFKLMWNLRSLEKEINEENGMLILNAKGDLELKNFSSGLTAKIKDCLRNRSV